LNYEGLVAVTCFVMLVLIVIHSAWSWNRFMFWLLADLFDEYGDGPYNFLSLFACYR
jgi:hypothetical protein